MIVLGAPLRHRDRVYNCAVVVHRGWVLGVVPKSYPPTYREFYEERGDGKRVPPAGACRGGGAGRAHGPPVASNSPSPVVSNSPEGGAAVGAGGGVERGAGIAVGGGGTERGAGIAVGCGATVRSAGAARTIGGRRGGRGRRGPAHAPAVAVAVAGAGRARLPQRGHDPGRRELQVAGRRPGGATLDRRLRGRSAGRQRADREPRLRTPA